MSTNQPKNSPKRFFNKILRKTSSSSSHGSSSVNTKVASTNDSKTSTPTRSVSLKRNASTKSNNTARSHHNYLDEDGSLYDEGIDQELELDEISVTSSAADLTDLNNFDHHQFNEKVHFPTTTNVAYDTSSLTTAEPPWSGLTYESLRFPKYIKTSKKHKLSPRLNHLFLAQELNTEHLTKSDGDEDDEEKNSDQQSVLSAENQDLNNENPNENLVMEFSKDGMYLAAAGRDGTLRVWKVISSPLARLEYTNTYEMEHRMRSKKSRKPDYCSAPVFHKKPYKVFKGHSQSIISLDWSKNNFIITGSMDRTAKLWHVDREECLQTFKLNDFVTAIRFHPTDDRFFASGSLDNRVLLWSILEKSIAYEKVLDDQVLITSLCFTPDGEHLVVGGFNGSIFAMETKGLFVLNRIEIKNNSLGNQLFYNPNNNGNKITGVKAFQTTSKTGETPIDPMEKWTFLITTNDSKIRLVNSVHKKLVTRFRGLSNNSSSIVASTSSDNKYIISGSEDHRCYIWENNNSIINNKLRQSLKEIVIEGKQHISEVHKHKIYGKLFPDSKFLNKFMDSGPKNNTDDFVGNENNSYTAFHAHHSRVNVAVFAPDSTRQLLELSDDIIYDLDRRGLACKFNSKGKGQNIALKGQIIVTTDQRGLIRVFRQDSAYYFRKNFIEMHKQYNQKNASSEFLNTLQSSQMGTIDGELSQKECPVAAVYAELPEAVRSLSPTSESFPLKKLHNRFRGNSNVNEQRLDDILSSPSATQSTSNLTIKNGRTARGGPLFSSFRTDPARTRSASPTFDQYSSQDTAATDPAATVRSIEEKFKYHPTWFGPDQAETKLPIVHSHTVI